MLDLLVVGVGAMGSAIVRGLLAADAPVGALGVADVDEEKKKMKK